MEDYKKVVLYNMGHLFTQNPEKMKKPMILIGLLSFVMFTKGQDPQIYFNLNTTATGTKSYVARDYVKLKPGFSYKPATANSFEAKIDPTITYPVIYQKPFASVEQGIDQGLDVGSIAGAFDVSPSGAATYSVPIDLPIGIDGMQPGGEWIGGLRF